MERKQQRAEGDKKAEDNDRKKDNRVTQDDIQTSALALSLTSKLISRKFVVGVGIRR